MGGHHHPQLPEIPDWRIYRVEDAPELVQVQKALAKHGLSDPWLRNEVWRFVESRRPLTPRQFMKKVFLHGFKYGAIAAAVTIGVEYFFFDSKDNQKDHH